jgi:bacterioferritin
VDKAKIIELLNKDLQDEHGAIIQYLNHAYGMGEGEEACEIEAISRDEMRHLDWLAESIVELGGTPSLEKGKMLMGGAQVADWMKNDVALEEGAIAQYEEHIKIIDDPKIKRLLRRIVSDEQAHHQNFEHFVEKALQGLNRDVRGNRKDRTAQTLNWGIAHEYTVVLQYLLHSYMNPDEEAKKQLEDQAINEMQHLGWLSERLVSDGGSPKIEHTEVNQSTDPAEALKADIKIEKEVAEVYDKAGREAESTKIRDLLFRIRDNELYHIDVFGDLLKMEEKREKKEAE